MIRPKESGFAEFARQFLLQTFAPASVVTNSEGDILYVHGETGKYLRPAPGRATLNVIAMARDELQPELRAAIRAAAQGAPTIAKTIAVTIGREALAVNLSVRPLPAFVENRIPLLITFEELPAPPLARAKAGRGTPPASRGRVRELENELNYVRENLHATIEEQQASNEELTATNEELQSTNEELQSAIEELETSREELQSVNEELVTLNAELQSKIGQLSDTQNDLKNFLDNIEVGTIFLDNALRIRRTSREAARLYRLVESDVGRPLADIKCNLVGVDLIAEAKTVHDTLAPYESELCTAEGEWFLARIQPYRTLDNVIDGVVLTFTNIDKRMAAEVVAHQARELAEGIVDTVHTPLLVLDGHLKVVTASRSYYLGSRTGPEETVGRAIYELGFGQWDVPRLRELLEGVLPRDGAVENFVVNVEVADAGRRQWRLDARRIESKEGARPLILLTMEDVGAPSTRNSA